MNRRFLPDLKGLFERHSAELKANFNCISIGTIKTFDSAKQTAKINLNYKSVVNKDIESQAYVNYPLLIECPVVVLTGGTGYITMPITTGDTCLVFFCDRDIDNWHTSGNTEMAPNSERMHSLSDAIALVGIRSLANAVSSFYANGIQLKYGANTITLDTNKAELKKGTCTVSAEDKALLQVGSQTLKDALDDLCSALTNWVDTRGDTPNGGTVSAINAAKAKIDAVLK